MSTGKQSVRHLVECRIDQISHRCYVYALRVPDHSHVQVPEQDFLDILRCKFLDLLHIAFYLS